MSGLGFDRSAAMNAASYPAVDTAMWIGMAGMINAWRRQVLQVKETRVATLSGGLLTRLQVPFSYMWSPAFLPKPADWPPFCEVVGAFGSTGAGGDTFDVTPFAALLAWLAAGPPPVFVGFG